MARLTAKLSHKAGGAGALTRRLQHIARLDGMTIRTGFLEGQTYPDEKGVAVAQVAAWNEYGHPPKQPPRPFMRNAVANNRAKWADTLTSGLKHAIEKDTRFRQAFDVTALVMVGDVQDSIRELVTPPLSPITVAMRAARYKSLAIPGEDRWKRFQYLMAKHPDGLTQETLGLYGKGNITTLSKPLVDTGVMLRSVNYDIRRMRSGDAG